MTAGRREGPPGRAANRAQAPPRRTMRPVRERWGVTLLLGLHAALVLWGAARNSVTFDENLHLPAGVMMLSRGDFGVEIANPPLVRALCALPPLLMGAQLPDPAALAQLSRYAAGESFMRRNRAHYHSLFFAARSVIALLSLALALLVWRFARRLYGARAGLLALAFYGFSPDALAHAGVLTLDVATALGMTASLYALWIFARSGRWHWWAGAAIAVGLTFLTRFTAVLLAPMLIALAALSTVSGEARRPRRLWLGLALLVPTTLLVLNLGYLGQTSLTPLGAWTSLKSPGLLALRHALPGLRLPLPDDYVAGFDHIAFESQPGFTTTYLLGRIRADHVWYYYPLALLFKWPLGLLAALVARTVLAVRAGAGRRVRRDAWVLVPVAIVLIAAMFGANLNVGVRYVFPILPLLCVWLGGLVPDRARLDPARVHPRRRAIAARGAVVAVALLAAHALESVASAPWYLSFYNRLAGGPGGGYRLVNDSNVDWGQGLIALREELNRRGIRRIYLAYHGTTDPAVYGIDYVPYLGGVPGTESDWLAVSSYYFVGLTQRMMTPRGRTDWVTLDFRELWGTPWVASPAHCMYLFHFRQGRGGGAAIP